MSSTDSRITKVPDYPDWVRMFHHIADDDAADSYRRTSEHGMVVMLNVFEQDEKTWAELKDAQKVWLVYRKGEST